MRSSFGASLLLVCAVTLAALVIGCGSERATNPQSDGQVPADAGDGGPVVDDAGPEVLPPEDGGGDGGRDGGDAGDAAAKAPVGAACAAASECQGSYCITAAQGFPDGYCTHRQCDLGMPAQSCLGYGGDGFCVDIGDVGDPYGLCFDRCDVQAPDCRTGYECDAMGGTLGGICLPTPVCGNDVVERGEECEPPGTSTCNATCQGTGTAAIGAPCASAADCTGDYCFAAADGWPAGYCSQRDCDLAAETTSCQAYGGDGLCLDVGDTGAPYGMCFDRCNLQSPDCRNGYECVDMGGGYGGVCLPVPVCGNGVVERGEECEPPGTSTCTAACQGVGTAAIGAPCTAATGCSGDYCFAAADGWPGGYCSQRDCDTTAPTSSCLAYGGDGYCYDVGDAGAPYGMCFDRCDPAGTDCRNGYECVDMGGAYGGVCLPVPVCGNGVVERGEECEPPNTSTCTATCQGTGAAAVGAACAAAADCAGDYCFPAADGWPGGYCSQLECDTTAPTTSCLPYGGDGFCVDVGDAGAPYGVCFDRCDPAGTDCRTGYTCEDYGLGGASDGLCFPTPVCGNGIVESGEECEPPSTSTCTAACQGTGTAEVGAVCTSNVDCGGNYCFAAADGWPGGYCSQIGCDLSAPKTSCLAWGPDAVCVNLGGSATPVGGCLDGCKPMQNNCRTGYACYPSGLGGSWVCYPQ
jgi:hypothetical protein